MDPISAYTLFFQAEDGIRDGHVTGVQTCALPIYWGDLLQGPANISGMLSMDGNRYQRRVIVQTSPGEQWGVERELRGRFRAGFSRSGLEFAVPRFIDVTTQA